MNSVHVLACVCVLCVVVNARGCNADCRTKRGCTPFFLACKEGHQKVSQLLLEHSADPEVCLFV